jgi:hypothetical protein
VSVFEWDSESESDAEEANHHASASFAKRIARGFANIQGSRNSNNHHHHHHQHSSKESTGSLSRRAGSEELTRVQSGEAVAKFRPGRPSRQRALTVEDIRRVEEDIDGKLRLAREQVARERSSNEVLAPPPPPQKGLKKEKSAVFGRLLAWRTQ